MLLWFVTLCTPAITTYIISGLTAIRYCNACMGCSRWYIWVPFGVREIAICEASEERYSLGVRAVLLWSIFAAECLCAFIGGILYCTISYKYRIVPNIFLFISGFCYIYLYVTHSIYIYHVATESGKHGIIWTVLHILLGGIADPFVYYYIAGDIEQNA